MFHSIDEIFEKYPNLGGVIMLQLVMAETDRRVLSLQQMFKVDGRDLEVLGAYYVDKFKERYKVYTEEDFYNSNSKIPLQDADMLFSLQLTLTNEKNYRIFEFDVNEIVIKNLFSKMHQHAMKMLKVTAEKGAPPKEDFDAIKKWGTTFDGMGVKTSHKAKIGGGAFA